MSKFVPNFVHAPPPLCCTSLGMKERFHVHVYTLASRACLMYSHSNIWTRIKILHEMRAVLRAVIICFVAASLAPQHSLPLVYCTRHQGRVHLQALAPPSLATPYRLVNNYPAKARRPAHNKQSSCCSQFPCLSKSRVACSKD